MGAGVSYPEVCSLRVIDKRVCLTSLFKDKGGSMSFKGCQVRLEECPLKGCTLSFPTLYEVCPLSHLHPNHNPGGMSFMVSLPRDVHQGMLLKVFPTQDCPLG